MNLSTINIAPLDRRADVGAINDEARTVEVVFSTAKGGDVLRYDWDTGKRYWERLSLRPDHVRLERLNGGAPLLNSHSAYTLENVIGVVEEGSVELRAGEALATVRFSRRDDVEPFYRDVRDKIIRNVSVGYRVHRFEEQVVGKDGFPIRLATDWEPYEISLVPMGADAGARVRAVDDVPVHACVLVRAEEGLTMEPEQTPSPETTEPAVPPQPDSAPDADAIRSAERDRVTGIQDAVRVAGLDAAVADALVRDGATMDAARSAIFTKLAERSEKEQRMNNTTVVGEDPRDTFARGVSAWLLQKSGLQKLVGGDTDPGEFRGLTLVEIAREALHRAGVSTRGMDKMTVVAKALARRDATQSTSDFAYALENTMHKVLQAAYAVTPDTWTKWCKRGTVSDFRAHYRYRMGHFGALDSLSENGEFKTKPINDAERASITAGTKGNLINVSRQMIVNDDMGVFTTLLTGLGRAAALSVESAAYALLGENSGLGPTQSDSQPLFHSNRTNVGSTAALSTAAIDADAAVMARQKDVNAVEYLDLQPAVLLVARESRGTAVVINESQYDPDTVANKGQMKPNAVRGLFRDVVGTPRLTGTRRYLFADPNVYPVFEVAFLEGQESPVLETKEGWNTDGAEMKVRFDFGVAAVDFRGAVTNAG